MLLAVGVVYASRKLKKRKEEKRLKQARDDERYRELQEETQRRMSQSQSEPVIENSLIDDLPDERDSDVEEHEAVIEQPPPAYEDAMRVNERRERERQVQSDRRRLSLQSSQGTGGGTTYARMG